MPFYTEHQLKALAIQQKFNFSKEMGQCFLVNLRICNLMLQSLQINSKKDNILEIGPGFGAFSHLLAKKGKCLYLVEFSPVCSKFLEKDFLSLNYSTSHLEGRQIRYLGKIPQKTHITIIQADILNIPWPSVDKIISNLHF